MTSCCSGVNKEWEVKTGRNHPEKGSNASNISAVLEHLGPELTSDVQGIRKAMLWGGRAHLEAQVSGSFAGDYPRQLASNTILAFGDEI